jgi:branched-chain amino acid transport system permease protein
MTLFIKKAGTVSLVALLVILFPLIVRDRFLLATLIESGIWCLCAIGFAAVFRVGQISMGQASFMAIGGYTAALLSANAGVSIWLTLPIAGAAAAMIACLLGLVVLRIGGLYFAIATLAFGEITSIISLNWSDVTQGPTGIALSTPDDLTIGGLVISFSQSALPFYYLSALLVAAAGLVFWRIDQSRLGRITRSVAENDILSEHLGMHLMKYRVIMFTLAGFFTGVGGALYVHYLLWVGPPLFSV